MTDYEYVTADVPYGAFTMSTAPGKTRTPSALLEVIDADAYEYLSRHAPEYLVAVETEVARGVTPEEIKRFLLRHLGPERVGLVLRCEQAARYLVRAQT